MILNGKVGTAVARVLQKCTDAVEERGRWHWSCAMQNGSRLSVDVRAADGFLQFAAESDHWPRPDLSAVLQRSGKLAGTARFALTPRENAVSLRADVVMQEEPLLPGRVAEALRGIHEGSEWLSGIEMMDRVIAPAVSQDVLAERLRETQWPISAHGPNEFSVDLEAENRRARVALDASGVDAKVELVRTDAATVPVRQALAVMLLTQNGALRLVRAYSTESGGQITFGFQVRLAADTTVTELDHAMAALSTASRLCGREVNALLDEAVAGYYLSMRGLPPNNT